MNRFIINLRTLGTPSPADETQHFSRFTAPNFRVPETILGNIGEPLTHGDRELTGNALDASCEDQRPGTMEDGTSASSGNTLA